MLHGLSLYTTGVSPPRDKRTSAFDRKSKRSVKKWPVRQRVDKERNEIKRVRALGLYQIELRVQLDRSIKWLYSQRQYRRRLTLATSRVQYKPYVGVLRLLVVVGMVQARLKPATRKHTNTSKQHRYVRTKREEDKAGPKAKW